MIEETAERGVPGSLAPEPCSEGKNSLSTKSVTLPQGHAGDLALSPAPSLTHTAAGALSPSSSWGVDLRKGGAGFCLLLHLVGRPQVGSAQNHLVPGHKSPSRPPAPRQAGCRHPSHLRRGDEPGLCTRGMSDRNSGPSGH